MVRKVLATKDDKCVIFSHFLNFLEILKFVLAREQVCFLSYDGSMTQRARANAVAEFNSNPGIRLLLISIKCGGVGLNLTAANHVFLMEPWWNPAFEHQAIDRVYRIGQQKTVQVAKFISVNTVEERIKNIQDNKLDIASYTLSASVGDKTTHLNNLQKMFV